MFVYALIFAHCAIPSLHFDDSPDALHYFERCQVGLYDGLAYPTMDACNIAAGYIRGLADAQDIRSYYFCQAIPSSGGTSR